MLSIMGNKVILLSLLLLILASCNKDNSCKNITCHGASCKDGECNCPYGYIGNCDSTLNTMFTGKYIGSSETETGTLADTATVTGKEAIGLEIHTTSLQQKVTLTLSSLGLAGYSIERQTYLPIPGTTVEGTYTMSLGSPPPTSYLRAVTAHLNLIIRDSTSIRKTIVFDGNLQ